MKTYKVLILAGILAGGCFITVPAWSSETTTERVSPANYMPWFAIPSRYIFSGNYYTHLTLTEMRIDHVSDDSRCTRKNRTFMISASVAQPIGNRLFSTQCELPLLSADHLTTHMAPASVGDYVLHLSNSPLNGPNAQLLVSTRF